MLLILSFHYIIYARRIRTVPENSVVGVLLRLVVTAYDLPLKAPDLAGLVLELVGVLHLHFIHHLDEILRSGLAFSEQVRGELLSLASHFPFKLVFFVNLSGKLFSKK